MVCDGKNIAAVDDEIELTPGAHDCSASKNGFGSKATTFTATPGQVAAVEFDLPPLPAATQQKAAAAQTHRVSPLRRKARASRGKARVSPSRGKARVSPSRGKRPASPLRGEARVSRRARAKPKKRVQHLPRLQVTTTYQANG